MGLERHSAKSFDDGSVLLSVITHVHLEVGGAVGVFLTSQI